MLRLACSHQKGRDLWELGFFMHKVEAGCHNVTPQAHLSPHNTSDARIRKDTRIGNERMEGWWEDEDGCVEDDERGDTDAAASASR